MNRGSEHTIGVIPIDSIFSPVRRVSYDVEAARVGQRTDYDKLVLDVTTDGSMDPREAIGQGAEILIRQLAIFTDIDSIEGFGDVPAEAAAEPSLAHGMENFPIEELELGVRSYNCLKRVGIETIGDLVTKTEVELAAIPNFGRKSIEEVKETLAGHGLTLRGEEPLVMRHQRAGKKLGRDAPHRKALYANLTGSLIVHGRIKTTVAKAKGVRPFAEKMVTLGRRGDIHARRQALAYLRSQEVVHQLFPRWRRASPTGRAATRASSRSARAPATRRRWRTSSSSTTCRARRSLAAAGRAAKKSRSQPKPPLAFVRNSSREDEAHARVRRHGLPRLGGAARAAHGRGRRSRGAALALLRRGGARRRGSHRHRRTRAGQRRQRRRGRRAAGRARTRGVELAVARRRGR